MHTCTRIIGLVLAVWLTASALAGCADHSADTDTRGEADTRVESNTGMATDRADTESETASVRDAVDALRDTVDWKNQEFGILYVNSIAGYTEEVEAKEKADDTTSSAVINDAVYQRNSLFEEYGHLEFALIPAPQDAIGTKISAEVQTATGDFVMISQTAVDTANAAVAGQLYDYLSLDIDYDRVWWDQGTLDFALNGKVYFMNGPFNIVDDDVTFVMMFNKQLRENNRIENPYDTVKAGKWTLEYFNSVVSKISNESSGDGTWDEKDTYGFTAYSVAGRTFFYGAGLQYIKNNREMEMPELLLTGSQMEKALDVLKMANTILYDNHSSYVAPAGEEANCLHIFMEGRSLFYSDAVSYLRILNAGMDADYGILPIPKYDEQQEHYATRSEVIGSTLSFPTTVEMRDPEQFARALELYTLLSEMLVRPAYYDTVLTTRNVRDAESAEMVDLIFLHRTYDMAMYFTVLDLYDIFHPGPNGDSFVSAYTKATRKFDDKMEDLLNNLRG